MGKVRTIAQSQDRLWSKEELLEARKNRNRENCKTNLLFRKSESRIAGEQTLKLREKMC
jgi:hypothetical protein